MGMKIEEKQIAIPGDTLAEGMDFLPGDHTYKSDQKVIAERTGLVRKEGRAVKLLPLSGRYLPKEGDRIIGKVFDITMSGWLVETNSAYQAMLGLQGIPEYVEKDEDLTQYFDIGDYVRAKITKVTSQMNIDLTLKEPKLTKLSGGRIVRITPYKVPRVIGREGSMISLIKEKTGANIVVGQNGLIWIKADTPENELLAKQAIKKVEKEAHIQGLTNKMKEYLEENGGAE